MLPGQLAASSAARPICRRLAVAIEGQMADVFVSYARPNASIAKRIASALRKRGYEIWFDEKLPAHRDYSEVIATELDHAAAVLVLWSEAATQSQWVRSEAN